MSLKIEPLTRFHDRKRFTCSDDEVDLFLREKVLRDQDLDLSRTSVLVNTDVEPARILGYYTLVILQVPQDQIPDDRPKIKRGIPVVLLGQLGIDIEHQGKGYGDRMLANAQNRICQISEVVGVRAMVLDARTERLVEWYASYGFVRIPGSKRMVKPIETMRSEFL